MTGREQADPKKVEAWQCGLCQRLYLTERRAFLCCRA